MAETHFWRTEGYEVFRGLGMTHEYPRHWHEETLLCTIDGGYGELYYRGAWRPTPAGSTFLIPAGEIHANRGHCDHHNLYLSGEWSRFWRDPITTRGDLRQCLLELCRRVAEPAEALALDEARLDLETALEGSGERPPGYEAGAVRRARDYLIENCGRNIRLEQLAAVARLSPFHFTRVFRRGTGLPPHAFLLQIRLARARTLLREGLDLPAVAAETGFADQSHFTRHFRRTFGITPGVYRQSKNLLYRQRSLAQTTS
ncbi:MAG: AraC family transcriptional regulator [Bryobacteraceae bacterium]|nr:AraC family transcriptional regulator [Bryobacteraceae bacterium]